MAKQLISSNETKSVYHDESTAIKELCEGSPKAEALNEVLCSAHMEIIEVLNVPRVLGVSVTNGEWSIAREFVEDKILQQLMGENPDKAGECLEQMIDLHLLTFAQACPLLNKLKEKIIYAPKSEKQLDGNLHYELLTRLSGVPKHTKLCRGDFCPSNIIVDDGGKWYLVGWVHASWGNVSADIARTYLPLSPKGKKIADIYMGPFCDETDTEERYVQGWLPIVAAAQLVYRRPDEKELLESWINVLDYQ